MITSLLFLFLVQAFPEGSLPDSRITPGDVLTTDSAVVCVKGYARKVRDNKALNSVSSSTKNRIYKIYARKGVSGICCEVDHLIPLELGGSNSDKNLWPQPYDIQWNAHLKDKLENKLHRLVCAGTIDIVDAQLSLRTNWILAYSKYIVFKDYSRELTILSH